MSGQNGTQSHAAEEREEAPPIYQNGFHNEVGGPSEVHQNGFHSDARRSPGIYQNGYMSVYEIGSSSRVRGRTHSLEIEYSEESEEDLEEDPEEDLEKESEEDPQEEDLEEEEQSDESDVEEYRSEHFWSNARRYRNLREDAELANNQAQVALDQVRRQMRSFSRGMLLVGLYSTDFLRMVEGVPGLDEDNETINRRYVRGLGPEFDEIYEHLHEHFRTLSMMARRIEADSEWDGNPVRPYFFRRAFYPDYTSRSSGIRTNPYFVHRGRGNSSRRVRGRHTGIVIREPSVPHQAPPGIND